MLVTDGPATILVRQSVTLTLQPWTIENGLFPGQELFLAPLLPVPLPSSPPRGRRWLGPAVSNSVLGVGGGEIHYYL